MQFAETDAERLVKLASIRVELYTGGRQGRYESSEGRWSLAAPAAAGGAGAPEGAVSVERDEAAGAAGGASASEAGAPSEPDEAGSAPAGDVPDGDVASRDTETGGGQGRLGMNW